MDWIVWGLSPTESCFRGAQISQKSRCQEADMKPIPYWGPINVRHHHTKFSCRGNLISKICAPLSELIHIFVRYVFLLPPLVCIIEHVLYANIIAYFLFLLYSLMFALRTFYCALQTFYWLLYFVHQSFWKGESDNEGSQSSLQSLQSGAEAFPDSRFFTLQKRESSLDRSVASLFHLAVS